MKVNIQEVMVSTANSGRNTWQVAEVVYTTDRGENKTKKVTSIKDSKPVFDVLAKGGKGWYEVTKNSGAPYYSWLEIVPMGDDQQAAPAAAKSGVVKSTYETAEERKVKQLYIIRQSSISNAIEFLRLDGAGAVSTAMVIDIAQEFVDFVYGTNETIENMASMDSED